ncbi:MAG: tRNA (adenosine(37)-N6)-threonylcarbamoyltransferase complex transferase subunit TsaD [Candidatus Magasanikbacteria bacterium]|nr:tRNA (adenosine(37)-N6)-threonylcarbamoyltransferase complex transferase subunit TsaD [Candidatus Magasanikbacteria bacterium]
MLILGIESSCDDTSVALLECSEQGHTILAHKTASQIDIHKKYGGVVPEVAGRLHAEAIVPLIEEVLDHPPARIATQSVAGGPTPSLKGGGMRTKPDAIAVTSGPGLITGLIVGVEAARTLAAAWNIPLIAVNHIEGHIHSVELGQYPPVILSEAKDLSDSKRLDSSATPQNDNSKPITKFPALALVVSGGHTELVLMRDHGDYEILGKTRDDAAGECFDKVAKLLGLPYPGGPEISRLGENAAADAIHFPRPMLKDKNYDFSFAGLKTSALYYLRDHKLAAMHINPVQMPAGILGQMPEEPTINDFCASVEQAIVDVLVGKTMRAVAAYKPQTVLLVGGVAANQKLRETLRSEIARLLPTPYFLLPSLKHCMDNGAMIAAAGFWKARNQEFTPWQELKANPNLAIAE